MIKAFKYIIKLLNSHGVNVQIVYTHTNTCMCIQLIHIKY